MSSILPYSTLKNVTSVVPATNDNCIVGKHLTYPDITGGRKAQGGLRLNKKFKSSLPGIPLISIITVCLNSEKTLEQCIQSVLLQTYSNIEYIVIDGNSTDRTVELIKKYEDVVDYFLSEPDRGLYHALNKGLELATGDYILILNSDDWYEKDCVESLVKAKKYAGTSFVSALAQHVDQAGKPVQVLRSMPYDASLRLRMPLRHETMLLSADIYNTIGPYDESYRIIADFHLTTRLFENGYTHYEIPRPLLNFRNTGVSSVNLDTLFVERKMLIKSQFPFLDPKDEEMFGNLGRLAPHDLENIASKYSHDIQFVRTLKCYFEDRSQNLNQTRWKNYQINWKVITKSQNLPLISVILPVFNAQETLAACIESVLSQTLRDFELICINDSSPDDSQTIIEQYRLEDLRIISLVNDSNVGLGASRNRGVREAKGTYIFHIDPDDTMPPQALEALYTHAAKHGSDIVKGAYLHEQFLLGQKPKHTERKGLAPNADTIINISLAEMNDLLKTTEGHWSCLYCSQLAKRVPYPIDLKMGQDSIYLVNVMVQAQKVSLISDVVYHYRANSESAMNTFSFQKFNDALEWRRRAWHVLRDRGLQEIGDRLLQVYWGDAFFRNLAHSVTPDQMSEFLGSFREAFSEAGITTLTLNPSKYLRELFPLILEGREKQALALMLGNPVNKDASDVKNEKMPVRPVRAGNQLGKSDLKVATLCSMDHGGAGTGTQRRVEALRRNGVDARIFSLVVKSTHPYVERVVPQLPSVDTTQDMLVWREVRERAVLPVKQVPGFCATELFSLTDSVVDFRRMSKCFDDFDVIHLHWVVGMFDFKHAAECLAKKPLIWTLADMNAFTGGCHYSEGCEEYTKQCRVCPLLGGTSDLAHKTWKIKNDVYQQLENMHIVCPSRWMAERVAKSSLLGGKKIHYIPNPYPTERLRLTNKVLARIHLGLPVNKKLLLFGADSLGSYRKGSDLLRKSIDVFAQKKRRMQVEVIVFGNDSIKLPLPVHSLGYISDDEKLALAYSAADAFLFPSREDNAPLTIGESLSCGTPVVAFPVGHVPDIVKHGVTGYIAEYLDANDFATGIEWALNCAKNDEIKREITCRLSACRFHDPLKSVKRHLAVYHMAMHNITKNI